MVQLAITTGFIALFCFEQRTKDYVQNHPMLLLIAFVVMIVSLIILVCCGEVRRKTPMNYILLFIFTLVEGFMLGVIASFFEQDSVLIAAGTTAVVCLTLTLFSFQTKYDFTMLGGVLLVALTILLVSGIVAFFVRNDIYQLIYASFGALIFSIYLIYDTQLMLGGKHKYAISPEEYVFAALNLYLDVINIFLYILSIVGRVRG